MRRCIVMSCPFVAVLLLTFGGAACEDIETPAASCYYETNGVTTSCARFEKVACKNVGPYEIPICDSRLIIDVVDGLKDFNTTFRISNTIGYLDVENGSECWQLRAGGRQFTEDCVTVKLFNVPYSNDAIINLWTDTDQCTYMNKSLHTLQVFRESNGTFGVYFTFETLPEIEQVLLELWHGECEITCDSTDSECDLEMLEERNMTNFTAREYFTGLEKGYYCMRIKLGYCIFHTRTYSTPPDSTPPQPDSPKDDDLMLLLVSLSIAGIVLFVILAIFLKRRSYGTTRQLLGAEEKDPPAHWQSIHQQWVSSPDTCTELLLLYSRDCREFCDVMQAFSQLLKRFGNMKVLDPMEQNQMEEVSENISGWLAQHLQNPDVKVVIVVSEGAKQRQRALLNNQIVHITYPHFLDPIYTHALQQMHEDPNLGSNYTRIFPVRFEDFTPSEESLSLIVPLKCYVLLKHLGKLILELRGSNTPNGPDLEDIRNIFPFEVHQLESTIRIMKSYCAVNPHYISKHFSLVVPST